MPPLLTDLPNARLATEHAEGPHARAELADTTQAIATLDGSIRAFRARWGLFGGDPKVPKETQKAERIRARPTEAELGQARAELHRMLALRAAMADRASVLTAACRVALVHAGVALCEDVSGDLATDGYIHIYAAGDAGEASKRDALVFRDAEAADRWVVRRRYRRTAAAERQTAPGFVTGDSQQACLEIARTWVVNGMADGR